MFAATGGVSQRDIAQRAGVAQSTVAANKTFLVKSAKLLWEPEGGGLALVKDAEPSWWEEGDALDGFPRPEEVRAWWGGEGSPPHPPEPPDRADRDPSGAEKRRDEGARGDRQPADRGQEATDRPHRPDDHGPPGDRQVDGDDRGAADQDNGVPKANNPTTGEAIGMIGGFANHEQETKKHDPERIAELAASLRKRVAHDPGVLRLEHDYTDFGLELAAARLRWDSYGLSPKNFTEEEVHEALKILL
jgi:hypothetical protein